MPSSVSTCIPVRVKMRLQALSLWVFLSVPSIVVTIALFVSSYGKASKVSPRGNDDQLEEEESNVTGILVSSLEADDIVINDSSILMNVTFECYDNYTVYYPLYEAAKFWIEGVLLIGVGILGLLGNCLTLAVLSQSKKSTFNQLLIVMSVSDSLLIIFFILMSACTTVMTTEPHWFIYLFPYLLWPLGNISITSTVLMVAAVSTERYLAICRPLQYKPSPIFYVLLVFFTSIGVNFGRFLEFRGTRIGLGNSTTQPSFEPTELMADERYIMFSRYWTEIIVIGFLPLLALICLNYGIYLKIRKSAKFRKLNDGFVVRFSRRGGAATVHQATSAAGSAAQQPPLSNSNSETERLPLQQQAKNETPAAELTSAPVIPPHQPPSAAIGGNERSTKVLVGIVVVFLVCHVVRLVIQIDSVVHPSTIGSEHFTYCHNKGLFHSPYAVYILTSFNNLCLVLNSSINFVVYCMVGRRFRTTLLNLICHVRMPWSRSGQDMTSRAKHRQNHTENGVDMIESEMATSHHLRAILVQQKK